MQNQEDKNIINIRLKELGESLEGAMSESMSEERRLQIEEFFGDLISYVNGETQNLNTPKFIFEETVYGDKKSSENERKYLESVEALREEMKRLKVQLNVTDNQNAVEVSVGGRHSFIRTPISIFIAALFGGFTGLFNLFNGLLKGVKNLDSNSKENKIDNRGRISEASNQVVNFINDCSKQNLGLLYKYRINENLDKLGEILEPAVRKAVNKTQRKALDIFFSNCIDYVEGETKNLPIPNFIVKRESMDEDFRDFGSCVKEIREKLDWFKKTFGEDSDRVLEVRDGIIRSVSDFSEGILGYKRSETEQQHGDEAVVPKYSDPFENMDVDYLVNQNKNQDKMAEQQHNEVSELDGDQNDIESSEKTISEENAEGDIKPQVQNVNQEQKPQNSVPVPPTPPDGWENFGAFLKDDSKNDKQNDNKTIPKPPKPPEINNFYQTPILSPEQQAIKNTVNEIRKMFSVKVGDKEITLDSKDLNGTSEYHKDKIKNLEKKIKELEAEKNGIENGTGDKNFLQNALSTALINRRKNNKIDSTKDNTIGLIDDVKKSIADLSNLLDKVSKIENDSGLYKNLREAVDKSIKILGSIEEDELMKYAPTDEEFKTYDNTGDENDWDDNTTDENKAETKEKVNSFVKEFEKKGGLKDKISEINKMFSEHKEEIADIKSRIKEAEKQNKVKNVEKQIESSRFDIEKEKRVLEIFAIAEKEGISTEYVKFPHKIGQQTKQQGENNIGVESGKDGTGDKTGPAETGKNFLQGALSDVLRNRRENLHMHDDEDDKKEEDIDKKEEDKEEDINEKEEDDDFFGGVKITPLKLNKVSEDKKSLSSVNKNQETSNENENSDLKDETQKSSCDFDKDPGTLNKSEETMKENKNNGLDVIKEVNEGFEEDADENNNRADDNNFGQAPPINNTTTQEENGGNGKDNNNNDLGAAPNSAIITQSLNKGDGKETSDLRRSKTFDEKVGTGKNKEADKYYPLKRRNTISSEKMRSLVNIFENKDNGKKNRDNVQQSANLEKNKEKKSEERE